MPVATPPGPSVAAGPDEPCRHCWASRAQRLLSPREQRKGVRPSPTPASPLRLSTASRSAPTSSRPAASLTACRSPPPRWEVPRRADHDQGGWGQTDHHGGANGVVIPTTRRGPSAAPPTTTRFNPRPARRPGATRHVGWLARHARRVSILARPEGRALLVVIVTSFVIGYVFQSSPGPKAGRYLRLHLGDGVAPLVSILARPEGRALRRPRCRSCRPTWRFNPRPARRPGATIYETREAVSENAFQSSPGPKAGRYHLRDARGRQRERVSILARPEGRALPVGVLLSAATVKLFQSSPGPKAGRYGCRSARSPAGCTCSNPRPARRPGATFRAFAPGRSRERVSILARPEGRALLPRRSSAPATPGRCFNPRPARRPGATRRRPGTPVRRSAGFQSSPGPKAGRYSEVDRRIRQAHNRVSILARPEGRALPPRLLRPQHAAQPVSILARPEGRALLAGRPHRRALCFNPRPARRPGATTPFEVFRDVRFLGFQSSPGPKAGRYLRVSFGLNTPLSPFQSSPGPKAGRYSAARWTCSGISRRFNPRPARRPGATDEWPRADLYMDAFQSSPGPKAGRYWWRPAGRPPTCSSFNPRPARRPGATRRLDGLARESQDVSILARPEGRALPPRLLRPQHAAQPVSILARPEGRALLAGRPHRRALCFNPRPARRPGATGGDRRAGPLPVRVSILARPEGRALPSGVPRRRRRHHVNPRRYVL